MTILVTGAAGFIGFYVAKTLLNQGFEVIGYDNLNSYYDVQLKHDRLAQLKKCSNFKFYQADLIDFKTLSSLFTSSSISYVIHLAAQAGVRYSIENPHAYVESNLIGFMNILECCRKFEVKHLLYASSSSVYGLNAKMPYSVADNVDHPVSLYAATKKSNELLAHSYAYLYQIPTTGLRFFTVYGPWGRPDMAYYKFTENILSQKSIDVYNYGEMQRDFTYIDDVVTPIIKLMDQPAKPDTSWDNQQPNPGSSVAPYRIYNIGNHQPVKLKDFIAIIEKATGKKAQQKFLPLQPGDVLATYANVDDLLTEVNFKPSTPIEVGLGRFVEWYKDYSNARLGDVHALRG
jgi:UDP-glucuronate 4-epimerase